MENKVALLKIGLKLNCYVGNIRIVWIIVR